MHVSCEDIELIKQHGIPLEPRPEFVTFAEDHTVTFSERGRRLYRLACLLNGLSPSLLESVRNRNDLRELSLKIKQVRVMLANDEAERALNNGKISPESREMVSAAYSARPKTCMQQLNVGYGLKKRGRTSFRSRLAHIASRRKVANA